MVRERLLPTAAAMASLGTRAAGKGSEAGVFPSQDQGGVCREGPAPRTRLSPWETLDNGCALLISAGASGTPPSFQVTRPKSKDLKDFLGRKERRGRGKKEGRM